MELVDSVSTARKAINDELDRLLAMPRTTYRNQDDMDRAVLRVVVRALMESDRSTVDVVDCGHWSIIGDRKLSALKRAQAAIDQLAKCVSKEVADDDA